MWASVVLWVTESFLTRDQTHVPCIGREILYYWTTSKVPKVLFLDIGMRYALLQWPSSREFACNTGDTDVVWIPRLGSYPGGGNGNPLQYSCLKNPMDRGAWWATVHGVAKESDMTSWLNNNGKLFVSSPMSSSHQSGSQKTNFSLNTMFSGKSSAL